MKTAIRVCIILAIIAIGAFIYLNAPAHTGTGAREFVIDVGDSAMRTAYHLQKQGLVKNAKFFIAVSRLMHVSHKLQKGLYLLSDNMSTLEILDFIAHGRVYMVHVTIPEGYAVKQIAKLLESKKLIPSANAFVNYALVANDLNDEFSFLKKKNLEGFLFPSTYDFPKNTSMKKIAMTMVRQFSNAILARHNEEIRTSGKSIYTLLTIASIVEKEARIPEERNIVAQVYIKRLKRNMYLGSCPTVAYAVNKFDGQHLTYADLKFDSPYNTYIKQGLPPTPVANPGTASFVAALHPAQTDYLYFVSKNNGSHQFSRTLKEHNAAVAIYQKKTKDVQPQQEE
jgi:UPF0755 protein